MYRGCTRKSRNLASDRARAEQTVTNISITFCKHSSINKAFVKPLFLHPSSILHQFFVSYPNFLPGQIHGVPPQQNSKTNLRCSMMLPSSDYTDSKLRFGDITTHLFMEVA